MPRAKANGIEIEYQTWGPDTGTPVLLVGGLGVQIPSWSETLIAGLAIYAVPIASAWSLPAIPAAASRVLMRCSRSSIRFL